MGPFFPLLKRKGGLYNLSNGRVVAQGGGGRGDLRFKSLGSTYLTPKSTGAQVQCLWYTYILHAGSIYASLNNKFSAGKFGDLDTENAYRKPSVIL